MTDEQKKLISNFEARVRQLMNLCDSLQQENSLIRESITQKERELEDIGDSYKELLTKYNNLKLAQGTSLNEDERRAAKLRYTKLVREIDKCIALLNE